MSTLNLLMAKLPIDQVHVIKAEIPGGAWIILFFGIAMALMLVANNWRQ